MSTPIIEDIAANLLTTINGVTEANGYNQTILVKRASRVDFQNETFDDLTGVLYQTERVAIPEQSEYTMYAWLQHFTLEVLALNADASSVTIDTRLNQIAEDVSKALRVDIGRGGNAQKTDIGTVVFIVADDGSNSEVAIEIIVQYRVLKSDPYTKG